MSEFRQLLEAEAARFPSKQAFARALGITPSRFSRVLRGEHSLDVGNCLRLAALARISPSRVLRAAGKSEIADLIERLFGGESQALADDERDLVDRWKALSPNGQTLVRALIDELTPTSERRRDRERRKRA